MGGSRRSHLPGQAVPPVAVYLPLAHGSDQQTPAPPQLLALFDDVVPQPAGARGAAQALRVQLAEDPHAHLRRQRFGKVPRRDVAGGHQGAPTFAVDRRCGRGPGRVTLHDGLTQPARTEIKNLAQL